MYYFVDMARHMGWVMTKWPFNDCKESRDLEHLHSLARVLVINHHRIAVHIHIKTLY